MKKYVIEFFLLFLAIFLSFQAENLREYLKNVDEEEANLNELIKNLESDIEALESGISFNKNQLLVMDTVFKILSSDIKFDPLILARNSIQLIALRHFSPVQSTYNNIVYSGKMDIIRSSEIKAGLNAYYEFIEYHQNTTEAVMQFHSRRTLTNSIKNSLIDENLIEEYLGYSFPVGIMELDTVAGNSDLIASLLIKKKFIEIQTDVFETIKEQAIQLKDQISKYLQ